jgi:hypothetical protein
VKKRMVITTVQSLFAVLRDYLGEEYVPKDAWVAKFRANPSEKGRFELLCESDGWTGLEGPIEVKVHLKKSFVVGG